MTVIDTPGVYAGIPEADYHADPWPGGSLSVSGAKTLLDLPARFRWQRQNPPEPKPEFLIGRAAHALVLGVGADIVEIEADSWRTKAAAEAKAAALAEGKTPLLTKDHQMVQAMADRLAASEVPSLILSGSGTPEASLFVEDETGVVLRGRVDWLPEPADRMIVGDYKTAVSANPAEFDKAAANYRYHMQAAWYSDLIVDLGLASEVAFLFVVQEKTAPYEVAVCQLTDVDLAIGRFQNRVAVATYAECTRSGVWPGYGDHVHMVGLPAWFRRRFEGIEEIEAVGAF